MATQVQPWKASKFREAAPTFAGDANTDGRATGHAVASFDAALELARSLDDVVYVAGGGTIYDQAWPSVTDLDLTEVHQEAEGSVKLPPIEADEWVEVVREPHEGFDFVRYRRR